MLLAHVVEKNINDSGSYSDWYIQWKGDDGIPRGVISECSTSLPQEFFAEFLAFFALHK